MTARTTYSNSRLRLTSNILSVPPFAFARAPLGSRLCEWLLGQLSYSFRFMCEAGKSVGSRVAAPSGFNVRLDVSVVAI